MLEIKEEFMKTIKTAGFFAIFLALFLTVSCRKEGTNMKKNQAKNETYRLEVEKGHFIANIGGKRVLIDTGSPASGGVFSTPFWGDVDGGKTVTGVPVKYISELSGVKFDALMGMDMLSTVNFSFRLGEGTFTVSKDEPEGNGKEIPLGFVMGIPKVPVTVQGKGTTMVLDTGAFISYFSPAWVNGIEPVRNEEDYFPLMGRFTTPVHELEVGIAGTNLKMEGGQLPAVLGMSLSAIAGNSAILGNKLFEHFDADFLMLRKKPVLRLNPAKGEARLPADSAERYKASREEREEAI